MNIPRGRIYFGALKPVRVSVKRVGGPTLNPKWALMLMKVFTPLLVTVNLHAKLGQLVEPDLRVLGTFCSH